MANTPHIVRDVMTKTVAAVDRALERVLLLATLQGLAGSFATRRCNGRTCGGSCATRSTAPVMCT